MRWLFSWLVIQSVVRLGALSHANGCVRLNDLKHVHRIHYVTPQVFAQPASAPSAADVHVMNTADVFS